jgi:hypothetical protein
MKNIFCCLYIFMCLCSSAPAYAQNEDRKLHPIKIADKITIDARLDELPWENAPRATSFTQREPDEGAASSEDTEVRVLYDKDNLYFGIVAKDSDAKRVIVSELKKDFNLDNSDSLQIVLDTFHDQRNAYQFVINPAGAKWDAQMANEGREVNQSWDGVWYVKSRVVDDGWIAEVAIPFKTLKFSHAPIQTWGINFQRTIRRRNEDALWAPVPRIYNIQRVSLAGTLEGLEGIEPGANIKIKPYTLASFAQNPTAVQRRKWDSDVGLDVKYGVTSGLTWDFTYNTDFSQVEADEQQVNLSRFSLFFPEKREFFLENSGTFQFGTANERGPTTGVGASLGANAFGGIRPNQTTNDMILFFSRTIGLSGDARAIPILGGTRLTGRVGKGVEIGLLSIQQREFETTNATKFTVGRLRKNVFANSDIGVMIANKEVQNSSHYNRAYGADANFRFGRYTNVNSYIAKTTTPGITSRDMAGRLAGSYINDVWNFRASYTTVQENFNDEMGYVPRRGIRKYAGYAGYTWRPERWHKTIRSINPHSQIDYVLDPTGRLDTRYVDYHLPINFQNSTFIEVGKNPSYEYFSKSYPIAPAKGISIPAGAYRYSEYFVLVRTDTGKRVSGNGRWAGGPFYTGYKHSYQAGATYRHSNKLTAAFNYTHNNISLHEGRFKTNLLSTRINYGFSTTMFLNSLIQYNSDTHQWSSNVRFNIIHRPLSDIFIVYNERRDSIGGGLADRALIAKMTYMISR